MMSDRATGRGMPSKDYVPLRKPGEFPNRTAENGGKEKGTAYGEVNNVMNGQSGTAPIAAPLKKSTLNVNATEFVSKLNANANAFVPSGIPPRTSQPLQQPAVSKEPAQPSVSNNEVMAYVKDILDRLTQSPGEFDLAVDEMILVWKARSNNEEMLNGIACLIMEQSILEPNFTYTGARLCDFLANNTDNISDGKEFRVVFLRRCKEEHCKREEMFQNPSTVLRAHGLAMFLAELYCTFRVAGSSQPLPPLASALLEMIESLIKNGTDDSLLYAGRILKLTGHLLDDSELCPEISRQKNREKFDSIFDSIEKLTQPSSHVGNSVQRFLSSVINLRKSNWGRESFSERGAEAAAVSVASSVLSPEAKPFEYTFFDQAEPSSNPPYYNQEPEFYAGAEADYYAPNTDDDITPVTNPDQWLEYIEDENGPNDSAYQYYSERADADYPDEDDSAFTDEMQKDFDLFMSEQPLPPYS